MNFGKECLRRRVPRHQLGYDWTPEAIVSDPTSESAKAMQEVAKATGKAIDALDDLGGFVAKFLGAPLMQASGIVADKLKYMRWERQIRLIDRVNAIMKERALNAPTRPVPMSVAIPLFQAASMEESDELQDNWARLLVNAADVNSGVLVSRAFVSILSDFGPMEARVLNALFHAPMDKYRDGEIATGGLPDSYIMPKQGEAPPPPPEPVSLALWNLIRLGCASSGTNWDGGTSVNYVRITDLGAALFRACTK